MDFPVGAKQSLIKRETAFPSRGRLQTRRGDSREKGFLSAFTPGLRMRSRRDYCVLWRLLLLQPPSSPPRGPRRRIPLRGLQATQAPRRQGRGRRLRWQIAAGTEGNAGPLRSQPGTLGVHSLEGEERELSVETLPAFVSACCVWAAFDCGFELTCTEITVLDRDARTFIDICAFDIDHGLKKVSQFIIA